MSSYQSIIERKLDPMGSTSKDVIYRCPKCEGEEGSGHLYVNYEKGYYHCVKCNYGGRRLEGLLKDLHIDISFNYASLYSERDKELEDIISPPKKKQKKLVDYSTDLATLTEYYNLHTKPLTPIAYQYLLSRGLTDDIISMLRIMEGVNQYGTVFSIRGSDYAGRDYSSRIMIPSLRNDSYISFYVGRDYTGERDPKYLNPPKELAVASEDVWNLSVVDSDSVIICEGVFTAIASSPHKFNAVATYGKSIAESIESEEYIVTSQGEKLLNRKFKNYFIAYDADAQEESIKTCAYLYDRGANVYLVKIPPIKGPKTDVADIGYERFISLMREAIHYNGSLSSLPFNL